MAFVSRVFESTGVLLTPGTGFGEQGEGYFRIALTCPVDRLERALAKIESLRPWKVPHAPAVAT
jgi:LL-diaminopimelate aminotransferase